MKNALPSRENCFQLLSKYLVPEHIVAHSVVVEKIAVSLAERLCAAGEKIDVELVSRAALLHDIDKTKTMQDGFRHLHGKMSRQILEKEGYPKIGKIVEKHAMYTILKKNAFSCWEEKALFYADKRVNHDKPVSLEKRFDYLLERYGKEKKEFKKIFSCKPLAEKLEKEILAKIGAEAE